MEIADRQRALDGYAPGASGAASAACADAVRIAAARTHPGAFRPRAAASPDQHADRDAAGHAASTACSTRRSTRCATTSPRSASCCRRRCRARRSRRSKARCASSPIASTTRRHAGADGAAIAGVERGLAEVRDALRALTPAENLVGFDRAVQELSHKIDLIAGSSQDPAALKQLEGAIVAMRGIVSHVASNDALAKLSEEVRALGRQGRSGRQRRRRRRALEPRAADRDRSPTRSKHAIATARTCRTSSKPWSRD